MITDLQAEGYRCGVSIDADSGKIVRGSVNEIQATLAGWINDGPNLLAHWTVEAGCAPEFLRNPWIAGYIEARAKVAVFCQRKIDARRIEGAMKRRIFKH